MLLAGGCAHRAETVTIDSRPAGATVFLNGQPIGVTPLETQLTTTTVQEIRLEKPHFRPLTYAMTATQDPARDDYVRFGPLVEAGHYQSFQATEPLVFDLQTSLVPPSRGADAMTTFSTRILEADALLEGNQIDLATHQLMVQQLIDYFE